VPRGSFGKHVQGKTFKIVVGGSIVLLSLAFLGHLIYTNWPTLIAYQWLFNYVELALTLLYFSLAMISAMWGWHLIITRLASANDARLNARIYCYAAAAKRLPGTAWDIATRVLMYDQAGVSKALTGVASLLELLLIVVSGSFLYMAFAPFTLSYLSGLGTWPLVVALLLGLVVTHPSLITWIVSKMRKETLPKEPSYRDILLWLLMYVLSWVTSGLMLYGTIRSVYGLSSKHLPQVLADWTLAGLIGAAMTFVPSSLGLREVTLTLLMSRYLPEHIALVASLLVRLLAIGYSMLWMLISTRL